jgi:general secretion pathway protein I
MSRKGFTGPRGFTLLEVVIAMLIMASGILLLVNTWGGSFVRMERTQKSFELSVLLEKKMLEIEAKYRGKALDSISEDDSGDFEGYPDYSWKMNSKKLEFPDMASALVSRDGGVDQLTETVVKQMTETLNKSIKEVTVTITYNRPGKKKPLVYSVTTYFVDYSKATGVGIPGAGGG